MPAGKCAQTLCPVYIFFFLFLCFVFKTLFIKYEGVNVGKKCLFVFLFYILCKVCGSICKAMLGWQMFIALHAMVKGGLMSFLWERYFVETVDGATAAS